MGPEELKNRTKRFALNVITLVESLPKTKTADILGKQLLHSATSVGANYRAACRARSRAEFISKIGIVEEEIDESAYWLELLIETGIIKTNQIQDLLDEAKELTAIFSASGKTAKLDNPQSEIHNQQSEKSPIPNPKSAIRNQQSEKSPIPNPKSAIRNQQS